MNTTALALNPSRDYFATAHAALTVGYLLLVFVGLHPFPMGASDLDARADGDAVTRLVTFGLLFFSLPILVHYRRDAIVCVKNNMLLYAVVAVAGLSIFWSAFPELTLKRSIVLLIYAIAATAIAAGTTDLRRFHTILFAVLALVAVVDLASGLAWPARAVTPDGFRGLHMEKNGAGMVAMIGVVVMATWAVGASNFRSAAIGILFMLIQLAFLVFTRSKTSLALALLVLPIAGVFYIVKRGGEQMALLVLAGALAIAALAVGAAMAFDFDISSLLTSVVSDPTFTGRDLLWAFCYKMASAKPWLGYGYGAFWDVGEANDPLRNEEPGLWLGDVAPGVINEAHNGYLQLWLELGMVVTVVAVVSVIGGVYSAAKQATDVPRVSRTGASYAAISLLLLLYLLHNSTEANLFIRGMPFCSLALLLALLARQDRLYQLSIGRRS